MSENLRAANEHIKNLEKVLNHTNKPRKDEKVRLGVDLGTAYIVLVALGEDKRPLAVELEYAEVIRDGLVVDFMGAKAIVSKLKKRLEERLQVDLKMASIAVPPGTHEKDQKTHKYVVEGAGLEVDEVLDEPTAANAVLGIRNGAIVDIGGGTTGISILENGKVIYVADEATGGTHLSLVLAGHFSIPFGEAENMKKDKKNEAEILGITRPVVEKMASIVKKHIEGYNVHDIYLVGGTCLLRDFEKVFSDVLGLPVNKPKNPFLVTPLGIAMGSNTKEGS